MMILDIYMLRSIMKHMINREFNATLIITMNHCWIHLRTKQTNQYFSHPDSLTFQAAMYSASAELSAMDLCFLLYQETTVDPILRSP